MPKKDTRGDVLGLLSTGRDLRPVRGENATAAGEARADPAEPEGSTGADQPRRSVDPSQGDPDEQSSPVAALRAPRGRPARATTGGTAPRTLRLSQAVADELREAWLDEKRHGGDVLLSLQDFAGRVLTDGLQARGHGGG